MPTNRVYRYYQEEADEAIFEELQINNRCLVKMFCGTGKSLIMRNCKIIQNKKLVVFVFPTLSLITQFTTDYLKDLPKENILKISSNIDSTTDKTEILSFLSKNRPSKIICITYQSFKTLLDNLGEIKIDVCIFDEAHHAVGEVYQTLIFENKVCDDHISINDTVVSCDVSNTPLENNSVEISILSLAMWGSNCKEYIKEAYRILESGGRLYIIEPTKRWSEQDENKNIIKGKEGNVLKSLLEEYGFRIVEQTIEKFCMFVCIK
jgi:hypothetical protein